MMERTTTFLTRVCTALRRWEEPEGASRQNGSCAHHGGAKAVCGRGESGFTLIEVLVALTILSISLATLLAIFMQGLDRARESSNEAAARVLAQSLLTQAKAAPGPAFGTSTGKINGLQWRTQIEPYGSDADRTAWQKIPELIVATVFWRGDGGLRSVSLSTLNLLPKPGTGDDDNNDNDN